MLFCGFLVLICWLVGSVGISPPWYSWHWVHLGSIVGTTNLIYCSKIRSCTFQFCPKSIIVESNIWNQISLGTSNMSLRTNIFPPENGMVGRGSDLLLKGPAYFQGPFAASFAFKLAFWIDVTWRLYNLLEVIRNYFILYIHLAFWRTKNHPKMRPLPWVYLSWSWKQSAVCHPSSDVA